MNYGNGSESIRLVIDIFSSLHNDKVDLVIENLSYLCKDQQTKTPDYRERKVKNTLQ